MTVTIYNIFLTIFLTVSNATAVRNCVYTVLEFVLVTG